MKINGSYEIGLVPFGDMPNHSFDYNIIYEYNDTLSVFVMTAKRDIMKGETIYISYGNKGNSKYFLYYGFILEDNPYNTI